MILFIDTETTGKPLKYKAPVTDVENWPRMVQVAWIVFHEDGTPAGSADYIIKPDGWIIPDEAAGIHGITTEQAIKDGVPIGDVLQRLLFVVDQCEMMVGHNIFFDLNVTGAEYIRFMGRNPFDNKRVEDTMLSGTEFCKLPKTSSRGSDSYKWPRLGELYKALFGVEMGKAHTALQDITNTSRCYFEMKSRGIIK